MNRILDSIQGPEDLKNLSIQQLNQLCSEIREFLIETVSKTGGHLASNLGVVELTVALHSVFNSPEDKIIWDVGHQTYIHKILTGRKDLFHTLRQFGGISGFPKYKESIHDVFETGHSSTSISAALGMAKARDLLGKNFSVIAVIGDGALTGGMAFEALNDAGRYPNNLIVILNDNEMSIARNVGGMSRYLSRIRTEPLYFKTRDDIKSLISRIPAIGKSATRVLDIAKGSIKYLIVPGMIFEELGFRYFGPIDGHNIAELTRVFRNAAEMKGPILIHVVTKKGKGYSFAEKSPDIFHGISPFDVKTGKVNNCSSHSFSKVFGRTVAELAEKDHSIAAVTAAMADGTGFTDFARKFPERFYDVGIAEQHAVTFSAGLARCGIKPVFAVYSSFMQRCYDQILHDVALQNLHVVFGVDRAGIVGEDGETHQGVFDLSFLSHIPNMTILAPSDYSELRAMIRYAVCDCSGPVAIRYPKGEGKESILENLNGCVSSGSDYAGSVSDNINSSGLQYQEDSYLSIKEGRSRILKAGTDLSVLGVGNMAQNALDVAKILEAYGYSCEVVDVRFVKPMDEEVLLGSVRKTGRVVTIEDNMIYGGFGSLLLERITNECMEVKARIYGFPDVFIPHGSRKELYRYYKLDSQSIAEDIIKWLGKECNLQKHNQEKELGDGKHNE